MSKNLLFLFKKNKYIFTGFLFVLIGLALAFFSYNSFRMYKNNNNSIDSVIVQDYKVYVTGEVSKPGTYTFYERVTVITAIKDLLTNNSDLDSFNSDEYIENNKIYNVAYIDKLNINDATYNELIKLEGIGQSRANAIIEYRSIKKFKDINELLSESILTVSVYEKIKNKICV
ncbi:MAG: helix-hairpin-helix domain-containing protein [Anaeroplasmataceae bacterium]